MNQGLTVCVFATLISANAMAEDDIDQSLLSGQWCYKSILANGSPDEKVINTNWVFSDNGSVEIQSEWMRDKSSTMPYTLSDGRIEIPKMNKKYQVRKLTNTEMLLVNSLGSSENLFLKGKCE